MQIQCKGILKDSCTVLESFWTSQSWWFWVGLFEVAAHGKYHMGLKYYKGLYHELDE